MPPEIGKIEQLTTSVQAINDTRYETVMRFCRNLEEQMYRMRKRIRVLEGSSKVEDAEEAECKSRRSKRAR